MLAFKIYGVVLRVCSSKMFAVMCVAPDSDFLVNLFERPCFC